MRHRVYGKHLSRSKNDRNALFRGLVRALFLHEQIQTTQAKASAIKGLVDKLISQAKNSGPKPLIDQFVNDKQVGEKLLTDLAPRLSDRVSGYTSIIKLGVRPGDGAMMVQMKLLAQEPSALSSQPSVKTKSRKVITGKQKTVSKEEVKVA